MTTKNGNEERPLPDGWMCVTVEEVAEVNYGKGLPKRERNEAGEIPVYGSSGVTGYHTESLIDGPCLIIGRKGSAGAVHFSSTACWPIDTTYYVYFKDCISLKYAYYALKTLRLESLDRSTAIPSLSRDDLHAQSFPLAPSIEQERIVAEIEKQFTRLDAAVATLRRLQANLDRYKASVLKAACEGRLVPQDPDDEPAEQLLQRILAERRQQWEEQQWQNQIERAQKKVAQARCKAAGRPHNLRDLEPEDWQHIPEAEYADYLPKNDKWKQKYEEPEGVDAADLPELPEGWVWIMFKQLITSFRSGSSVVPIDSPTEHPILRSSAVRSGSIDYDDIRFVEEGESQKLENFLQRGDLLFTRLSGSLDYVGNCAVVKDEGAEGFMYADRIFRAQLSMKELGAFIEISFLSPMIRKQIMERAKSTAGHQRISMGDITEQWLPLPPLSEQNRIVEEVERRLSVVTATQQVIDANLSRAGRLRQSILQQAFSGRLIRQNPHDGLT